MNSFSKGLLLGVILALGLFYGVQRLTGNKAAVTPVEHSAEAQEMLSVKGENTLLKKMLGQVEGEVLIVGPVAKKAEIHGKLVWDNSMQQGFLHVQGLNPAAGYELVLVTQKGRSVVVSELTGQTIWQFQFKTPERILDLASVEIRGRTSQTETETVYARGVVSDK